MKWEIKAKGNVQLLTVGKIMKSGDVCEYEGDKLPQEVISLQNQGSILVDEIVEQVPPNQKVPGPRSKCDVCEAEFGNDVDLKLHISTDHTAPEEDEAKEDVKEDTKDEPAPPKPSKRRTSKKKTEDKPVEEAPKEDEEVADEKTNEEKQKED